MRSFTLLCFLFMACSNNASEPSQAPTPPKRGMPDVQLTNVDCELLPYEHSGKTHVFFTGAWLTSHEQKTVHGHDSVLGTPRRLRVEVRVPDQCKVHLAWSAKRGMSGPEAVLYEGLTIEMNPEFRYHFQFHARADADDDYLDSFIMK